MKHEQWLLNLLPQWKAEGLLTEEAEGILRERYASDEKKTPLWFIFLGSLGALLVGLGVITLFAANWKDIGRPARAVLSFIPLCLSLALYGAGLWRGWDKRNGFLDVTGLLWGLSVGACIALIAQTYQIPSDGRMFVFAWTLLLFPVMYATRSFIVTAGHYLGLLIWMIMTRHLPETMQHLWVLPMALLGLPVALFVMRVRPEYRVRGIVLRWFMLALGCVAYGYVFSVEKGIEVVTFIVFMYGLLFAALAQVGFRHPDGEGWYNRPWGIVGMLGSLIVTSLFAFGSYAVRDGLLIEGWHNAGCLVAMALLLAALCAMSMVRWRKQRKNMYYPLAYGLAPIFCIGVIPVAEKFRGNPLVRVPLEALVYLIALGVFTLVYGISERRLARANLGLLILLAVILDKFFESALPLTVKAIVFLVAGLCFFGLSFYMNRTISRRDRT